MKLPPPPPRAPSQLTLTKQDTSEGLCVFFPLGPISEEPPLEQKQKKLAILRQCIVFVFGVEVGPPFAIPHPPPHHLPTLPLLPKLCSRSDIGLLIK